MKINFGLDLVLKWLALCGWFVLFIGGVTHYSGSWLVYTMFSAVFLAMLVFGYLKIESYGYFYLTVLLWLGFWLKLTVHTIINYPFVEAIGAFSGGGREWDEVLYVATLASLGVMIGRLTYRSLGFETRPKKDPTVPFWYADRRKILWTGLIVAAVVLFWINAQYGIHLIGLAPRTILVWPLNALTAWGLNIGLSTGVGLFLWWDIVLRKNVTITIYALIVEAACSSVSILSRSVYLFHSAPQLFTFYRHRKELKYWSPILTFLVGFVFLLVLIITISAITTLRNVHYQSGAYSSTAYAEAVANQEVLVGEINLLEEKLKNANPAERVILENKLGEKKRKIEKVEALISGEKFKMSEAMNSGSAQSTLLKNEFGYQITNGVFKVILQLSIDRWTGLEGLMAVQAYPEKSIALFYGALTDRPVVGKTDIYQTISNSIYLKSDGTKFLFSTLPGAAAFMYFGNSGWLVIFGMAFLSLLILFSELFILKLTENSVLCSLYGALLANNVAQFGGHPRQSANFYLMLIVGIMIVWVVQSDRLINIFIRPKTNKEAGA